MKTLIAYFKRQSAAAKIAIVVVSAIILILAVINLSEFLAYIS